MAVTVITAGQSLVQLSVYLIPTAHTTSNNPAINRMSQDMELNVGCWISDVGCSFFDDITFNIAYSTLHIILLRQRKCQFCHICKVCLPFVGTYVFAGKQMVAHSEK